MAIATLPQQAKESTPPLAADLNVVKKGQGPGLTTVDEFYKVRSQVSKRKIQPWQRRKLRSSVGGPVAP